MAKGIPKRVFTAKELAQLEGYAAIRLPMEEISILMGYKARDAIPNLYKTDEGVRKALDEGQAKSKGQVRQTLYQLAMGRVGGKTVSGEIILPKEPDIQALKFWCQTQEDFKTTHVLDLRDGAKEQLTDEQLAEKTAKALAKIAARPKKNG